ncbi:MAG: response regulator [Stagnimonas sp.]|nr:response regulator [Stagnimonas sp.]
MRILLVEDDEAVSRFVQACLIDDGHEVITAVSPDSALEAAGRDPQFDLLIADLNLGATMDGADIAVTLQNRQPRMAVLMITGLPYSARKRLANGRRAVILGKPFVASDLLAAVDNATADLEI